MDQAFVELIGKPQLNPAKIITVIADNFSLIDDQARFLRAVIAIPSARQLSVDNVSKHLIQFGPIHSDLRDQIQREQGWFVSQYYDPSSIDCDKLEQDVNKNAANRALIFINDVKSLDLCMSQGTTQSKTQSILRLIDRWKRIKNFFVIVFYQDTSTENNQQRLLRDLNYISDASIRTKSIKDHYFQEIWYQPMPMHKTLLPAKIQTSYYTCKIGKSYWSDDLLCFHERVQVTKNYDPMTDSSKTIGAQVEREGEDELASEGSLIENLALDSDDQPDRSMTLPYIRAQNPEQSRIFYYPDKDDDIDEDDPDNDLNI